MSRQNIGIGAIANDLSGDTLRQAGQKMNENFVELYKKLGGDSDTLSGELSIGSSGLLFEGASSDSFQTILVAVDPTASNTVSLPDVTGVVVVDTATQTLTNKTLTSPILTNPQINDTSGDHQYIFAVSELVANRTVTWPLLSTSDTLVFQSHAQTLTNKTLTAPSINIPRIITSINDTNNAELIKITSVSFAVNEINVSNNTAGNSPIIAPTGDDTNIGLSLASKGTGAVQIAKVAYSSSTITAGGAASNLHTYIICNSGTALAVSLANGTTVGEYKIFTNKGAGTATVTPANFAQGTTFALSQFDGCTVVWDGTNWYLVGNQGEVAVA